jgi:DNA-binding transcriptional regulator YbjK
VSFPNSPSLNASLAARIRSLESRLSALCSDLGRRTEAIEKDLETSLVVSEKRAKKLDELYREASAENEALYERFNTELSKVANDVRLGSGEESLKSQLREALEEVAIAKKENMRLRREVGGLKVQQADQSPVKEDE